MIFPNMKPMDQNDFEGGLILRWGNELIHYMLEEKAIYEYQIQTIAENIQKEEYKFHWIQNTDASVNGHLTDSQLWIEENYRNYGYSPMDFDECFSLAYHINQFRKKRKVSAKPLRYERFYPIERMVADGLFRFSDKGDTDLYAKERFNQFPHPYHLAPSKAELMAIKENSESVPNKAKEKLKDNIVSLAKVRSAKNYNKRL